MRGQGAARWGVDRSVGGQVAVTRAGDRRTAGVTVSDRVSCKDSTPTHPSNHMLSRSITNLEQRGASAEHGQSEGKTNSPVTCKHLRDSTRYGLCDDGVSDAMRET